MNLLKKIIASFALFALPLLLSNSAMAQDFPPKSSPPRLVNDFVGMLSSGEKASLEQKLKNYSDSTSTQITVVILKSTGGYPPGDYAFALGEKWGVGQKDKDNGIVLLWATEDRKIFIATGRGMEGPLPDAICKRIVNQVLIPNFKNQAWYEGLDQATSEIFARATGEYKNENQGQSSGDDGGAVVFIVLIIIAFLVIAYLSNRNGGGRGRGGYSSSPFPYITMSSWGSSGGSWSGGGSSGGDSGFGGFGGGSFGGGGAGGDY